MTQFGRMSFDVALTDDADPSHVVEHNITMLRSQSYVVAVDGADWAAHTSEAVAPDDDDVDDVEDDAYSVDDEPDYARTYDERGKVRVRRRDLRAVLDVATMSMDFASGFLVEEQVEALRKAARMLNIDPTFVTPHNFVCKYTGNHEWRTQSHPRHIPAMQPTGDPPELIERLAAAKAAANESRNPDTASALAAASAELQAARAKRRAEGQPPWRQPPYVYGRPEDMCWRCRARRQSIPIWVDDRDGIRVELVRKTANVGIVTVLDTDDKVLNQREVPIDPDDANIAPTPEFRAFALQPIEPPDGT